MAYSGYRHVKFFKLSILGWQACVSLWKVWLVTLTDENVLASIIGNMLDICLYHSEGILPMEWTVMAVNSAQSYKNIDFCLCRNDVCPVMATCTFLVMAQLTSFYIYNSMCIYNSKCLCACLVCRKVIKPDLPDCLLWPCNVCILTMWLWLS